MSEESSLLWSLEEVARQLGGISKCTVRRLIHQGELASCRVGRRLLRVPAESVRSYVERTMKPVSHAKPVLEAMTRDVAVMSEGAENSDRVESVACKEKTPCRTDARTRLTGGSNTPGHPEKSQLTDLLKQLIGGRRKRSKPSGGSRRTSKGSGASSLNTPSKN